MITHRFFFLCLQIKIHPIKDLKPYLHVPAMFSMPMMSSPSHDQRASEPLQGHTGPASACLPLHKCSDLFPTDFTLHRQIRNSAFLSSRNTVSAASSCSKIHLTHLALLLQNSQFMPNHEIFLLHRTFLF